MAISVSEKLRRFYDLFSSDDRILIVINADPDAIASAMAVKRLLWRRVANITISNINIIKRPDNLAMIRLLDVSLVHIDEIDEESFNRFIMVDSQPDHHEVFSRFNFDVVIDHHPETDVKGSFIDIRPKYGATATIMTEYLRAARIRPTAKLATGLFYAIKTDTSDFERQTLIEDIRAFQFLFRHINIHLARRIEQADLKLEFLKYFGNAIQSMRRRKNKIYAHLGSVVNPDICVLIADFFMRIDSINWSIVSGIYAKKLIIILRNDGLRRNAGNVARLSFGRVGSAGGHKSTARSEISVADIKDLVDYKDDDKLLTWIVNQINKRSGER